MAKDYNPQGKLVTVEQEIANPFAGRPHVVILGAGASKAAFPNGDKFGHKLPLMDELIDTLHFGEEIKRFSLHRQYSNFEALYSALQTDESYLELVLSIEERVTDYFLQLRLPDHPTLYDHLVLSLRPKDVIATFNWDPLLFFACSRHHQYIGIPKVLYLHGNVAIGHCIKDRIKGPSGNLCPKCKQPYTSSKLLFPVLEKNYTLDQCISAEWQTLNSYLNSAFVLTIFGYGAPKTDIEAVKLMKEAWGPIEQRSLDPLCQYSRDTSPMIN